MTAPDSYFSDQTAANFQEHVTDRRMVASDGIWMIEVDQPPGDFPDPPIPELVLQQDLGRCRAECDFGAGRFAFQPGHLGVVAPMTATSILCHNQHQIRVLAVPVHRIAGWMEGEPRPGNIDLGHLHSGPFKNLLIEQLLERLRRESSVEFKQGQLFADAAVLTIWAELLRHARLPTARIFRGGLAPWQARRCIEYLNAHASEHVGLEQLAALVSLSPFHFARAFKHTTGVPPHRYQLNLRIARARELLETTDASVTEIAFDVGYESSQALARLFRREVGLSPSDYRRVRRG
jgi:AraC family transcriptional regulator